MQTRKFRDNLSVLERLSISTLLNDKSIIIKKADKSNNVVILDKSIYLSEANRQLGSHHYKSVDHFDFKRLRNSLNEYLIGANPRVRDNGRKLTAEEWARFINRHECVNEIAIFTKLKRFHFGESKHIHKRSNNEPDLIIAANICKECKTIKRQKSKSFQKKVKFHRVMTCLHPFERCDATYTETTRKC
ncbi:Hypothetical predicted protein [Mytilus galloprovincialis]|uniref:Uncharacterized protein n=1 Tax=Mytilus galloprovincialis TaxID=29158 RepID=A0A8B6EHJ5_MYTGA|nr:Hypothetical predicted protein [Mytilus galloprovincialis]